MDTGKIVSIARVNRDLATLRRILNVAREWKVIIIPPKIRLLPGEKTHDRVLSHEEENAYLQAAAPLLRDFAVIALDTGMRPEEILRMRFENVKFDPAGSARSGYIHNPDGKTKRAKRNLPMTSRVREVLARRHAEAGKVRWGWVLAGKGDEHVTYDTINCQHDRVMEKLSKELKTWRLYDMRHTYLTRLGESGADAFTIQSLARISHEWCPKLHFGDGKDVGGWVARAKMPAEGSDWAWTSGGEGNDDVKSDYRDSYPDQRSERWYV